MRASDDLKRRMRTMIDYRLMMAGDGRLSTNDW